MTVVDEVMQRMREMYSTNHNIGDMALGSVMQFVYRKLRWGMSRGGLGRWRGGCGVHADHDGSHDA